ncbi:cytochrome P450 4V2-like [Anticarsia gemmatalis]|uniref:cytochrome P450 4V2-like n=1 Tax=Anticarsia gemmatalis TaxID=129554 RepID=UPI003F764634
MLIALLCVLLCACVLLLRMRTSRAYAHKLPPAYYKSLPIIGITHLFLTDSAKFWSLVKSICEDTIRKGGVTSTSIAGDNYYFVTDPEDAMTVANTCLEKHHLYKFGEDAFGQSLFTASVPIWKRHRKLLSSAFSLPIIQGYLETFNRQAEKLVSQMDQFADQKPFPATAFIHNISLETSCRTAIGTTEGQNEEFFQNYLRTLRDVINLVTERIQNFWLLSDTIYKLSGRKKRQDDLVDLLHEMLDGIVKTTATVQDKQNNNLTKRTGFTSFLEALLELRENNLFTDKELREELDVTIAAAFEPTALTLEAALVLLGSYPAVQDRLFQEIMQHIGPDRDVTREDLSKLVYTEAVIKESLRIIPVAPLAPRSIDKDVELKNYTIPAGSQCVLMMYGIHRDPVWGPDADQFRPERWLEPDTLPDTAKAFAGFSIGRRSCVGKIYAMTSLKVSLVHLVRKYHVMGDHNKLQFKLDVTLKPVKGHEISLIRRNKDHL